MHKICDIYLYELTIYILGTVCYYSNRKGVNHMSKRKKKGGGKAPDSTINLTAAILNLITAILLLIEKLNE